eukprot:COSAG04_NODE_26795_length_290_cov_1.340314_1_plen_69_part_10
MSTSASSEQEFRLPRNQRDLHRQYAQEMGVDMEDIEVKVIGPSGGQGRGTGAADDSRASSTSSGSRGSL